MCAVVLVVYLTTDTVYKLCYVEVGKIFYYSEIAHYYYFFNVIPITPQFFCFLLLCKVKMSLICSFWVCEPCTLPVIFVKVSPCIVLNKH